MWKADLGQRLEMKQEYGTVHGPYANSMSAFLRGKLTNVEDVKQLTRRNKSVLHFFLTMVVC